MIFFKILAVLFIIFLIGCVAIVIEETMLGGRRRRKLERDARLLRQAAEEKRTKEG